MQYGEHIQDCELIHGDCIETLSQLDSESVDLVLTDPPYNLGQFMKGRYTNLHKMRENYFGAAGWDDAAPHEWELLMQHYFQELANVVVPGANVIVFMAVLKVETVVKIAEEYGFYYKTTGVWHKTNPMPRNMNLHFVNSTESWIHFTYKKKRGTFNNDNSMYHDFVESSVTPSSEKRFGKHPTQKPLVVLKHFISLLSNPGDLVLDPFMGSGSTGVAALDLGRRFIGVELDQKYYDIAKSRMSQGAGLWSTMD
ncbi:site-specific DNA-methyltransferase [Corynebacterium sp. S1S1]|uniref:DNA-methyltransferase n=1 Tax=Corynebacterium sp. S1S1 TaxID=1881619 RepID=UPI000A5926BF